MSKRFLGYLLLLIPAAPILLHLGEFIYPRYSDFSDLTISHMPNAVYIANSIREYGVIPLWSDLFMGGYPFSADPLAGIWYPPNWFGILLPAPYGFNLAAVLHLVWAGLGMAKFLSRQGLSRAAALFGGIAYAGMPKLFAHFAVGHISMVYSLAWYPWLLLAEDRRMSPGAARLNRLLPGCILGIIALADVRGLAYAGLLYLAYRAWRGLFLKPAAVSARDIVGQIGGYAGQFLFGLGIAAAQVVPLIQFNSLSTRANLTSVEALVYSLPATKLLNLFIPEFGGYAEWITYPGAVVMMLMFMVVAVPVLRRKSGFWIGLFAASMILALGSKLPGFSMIGNLPGVSLLRVPPRLVFLAGLAAAVAASQALDELIRGFRKPKFDPIFWMIGAAAFFFILIIGTVIIKAPVGANQIWGCASLIAAIALIGLAERGKLSPAVAAASFLALLIIDLVGVNFQSIQYRSKRDVFNEGSGVVGFLKTDGDIFRVYSPSYALPQLASARAEIEMASAIHPLQLANFAHQLNSAGGIRTDGYSVTLPPLDEENLEQSNRGSRIDAAWLGKMNVKYIAAHYPIEGEAFTQVWQNGNIRVYQNLLWRPRAWVEVPPETGRSPVYAKISNRVPGKITIQAEGPGRLVITEVSYPGWEASLDGKKADLFRVDELWMGVDLPEGIHRVELEYRPAVQYAGIALSIVCWSLLFFTAIFRGRR